MSVKHFCNKCEVEIDRSNLAPWDPDLCPEHMKEHREATQNLTSYTSSIQPGEDRVRVWY